MRFVIPAFAFCGLLFASADKSLPLEQTSNDVVEVTASLLDKDQVKDTLKTELPQGIVVVKVTVRPLTDKPVKIDRDDFMLLNTNDGERSQPYEPSQIAGSATLVVGQGGARSGGSFGQGNGPIVGGMPGTMGGPMRLPGNGGGIGSGGDATDGGARELKSQEAVRTKHNPLLDVLTKAILPDKPVTDPITGLLYFQMDGKVKPKDMEMQYKSTSGRLAMRFRP